VIHNWIKHAYLWSDTATGILYIKVSQLSVCLSVCFSSQQLIQRLPSWLTSWQPALCNICQQMPAQARWTALRRVFSSVQMRISKINCCMSVCPSARVRGSHKTDFRKISYLGILLILFDKFHHFLSTTACTAADRT